MMNCIRPTGDGKFTGCQRLGQGAIFVAECIPAAIGVIALLGGFGQLSSGAKLATVITGGVTSGLLLVADAIQCCRMACNKKKPKTGNPEIREEANSRESKNDTREVGSDLKTTQADESTKATGNDFTQEQPTLDQAETHPNGGQSSSLLPDDTRRGSGSPDVSMHVTTEVTSRGIHESVDASENVEPRSSGSLDKESKNAEIEPENDNPSDDTHAKSTIKTTDKEGVLDVQEMKPQPTDVDDSLKGKPQAMQTIGLASENVEKSNEGKTTDTTHIKS